MTQEIEKHPIPEGFFQTNTEVLIVGTFPPKKEYVSRGKDFFFYSSPKNQFWNRIDNIFPTNQTLKKTKTKNIFETFANNKKRKEKFAKQYNIGFLDFFTKVSRKKDSPDDIDLISVENIIENKKLLLLLKSSKKIKRICCTYKLAYESIKNSIKKISKNVNTIEDDTTANKERLEFIINRNKVEIVLLYPATRSSHKGALKDSQYKKYLFK
jgi:G:T/U-mismatch repair DNA glycosylase